MARRAPLTLPPPRPNSFIISRSTRMCRTTWRCHSLPDGVDSLGLYGFELRQFRNYQSACCKVELPLFRVMGYLFLASASGSTATVPPARVRRGHCDPNDSSPESPCPCLEAGAFSSASGGPSPTRRWLDKRQSVGGTQGDDPRKPRTHIRRGSAPPRVHATHQPA